MNNKLTILKESVIRKPGVRDCPFGLPISLACKNAGASVDQMTELEGVEKDKRGKQAKANRRVYVFHQAGERCVYADKIVEEKNIVNCDFGDGGERMRDWAIRPSPLYPRVFHGLGQYGLYSYPLNSYMDSQSAGQFFNGIFAQYSNTGEVMISKHSMLPDPILEKLVTDLSIKKE